MESVRRFSTCLARLGSTVRMLPRRDKSRPFTSVAVRSIKKVISTSAFLTSSIQSSCDIPVTSTPLTRLIMSATSKLFSSLRSSLKLVMMCILSRVVPRPKPKLCSVFGRVSVTSNKSCPSPSRRISFRVAPSSKVGSRLMVRFTPRGSPFLVIKSTTSMWLAPSTVIPSISVISSPGFKSTRVASSSRTPVIMCFPESVWPTSNP
mmetsp:Transcript_36524/g.95606  ORF Transcript_36524/g.95606 Transcript_36524/m.95606 type:complete len:206 (-) Transcript_36524:1800-2417(-)